DRGHHLVAVAGEQPFALRQRDLLTIEGDEAGEGLPWLQLLLGPCPGAAKGEQQCPGQAEPESPATAAAHGRAHFVTVDSPPSSPGAGAWPSTSPPPSGAGSPGEAPVEGRSIPAPVKSTTARASIRRGPNAFHSHSLDQYWPRSTTVWKPIRPSEVMALPVYQ